jgi:CubicO group peptidase (beta-lactamase class C family)
MRLFKSIFFILLLFLAACTKNPVQNTGFPPPETTSDGWAVASPASENLDVTLLARADKALKNDPSFVNIHTLTIARNGKLVFDEFYHAGSYDYHKGELTSMQSVTKSFTSIAMGIAIDKELITSINQTAQSLLPNLQNVDWSSGKDKITLKNILTMSAGFAGSEESDSLLPAHFARYMFSKPLINAPGTTFNYRTALTNTLGDVLTTAIVPLHTSLEKFMDSLLFKPLDITNYQWYYRSASGEPELGGGLFLSPRDMAKLGQLVLNKGKWNGQQVVSEKWIAEATREYFHFNNRYWGEMDGYGYLFWQRTLNSGGHTFPSIIALGYAGQYVVIIPSLQTVVAITSWFPKDKNWQIPLRFIEQYILPALRS